MVLLPPPPSPAQDPPWDPSLRLPHAFLSDPLTYKILVSCCTSAADAATLFTDMKRAGISLTPLIYHMLVEVMAQDNSKETWRLDGVIKDIHDRKCSIPDMFKTLTKDSLWVVASTVLKLRLPMEVKYGRG